MCLSQNNNSHDKPKTSQRLVDTLSPGDASFTLWGDVSQSDWMMANRPCSSKLCSGLVRADNPTVHVLSVLTTWGSVIIHQQDHTTIRASNRHLYKTRKPYLSSSSSSFIIHHPAHLLVVSPVRIAVINDSSTHFFP